MEGRVKKKGRKYGMKNERGEKGVWREGYTEGRINR